MEINPVSLSIKSANDSIKQGDLSIQELVQACRAQIDRLNQKFNAFITVSRSQGDGSEDHRKRHGGTLGGIPIAIKDMIETEGMRTTAGSRFYPDYIPENDAHVIEKLKQAGAVVMGKTNTHEIALGVTTNNPHYGTCRNPWDPERIPGGSSGGSAVAVATGMALGALGTDTGGSIRIPAALCGVVGLKPTYGRVSLRGVIPLSWNLDHVGPIAKTVQDAAIMLKAIRGYDPLDPASVNISTADDLNHPEGDVKKFKIIMAACDYFEDCDNEVEMAVQEAGRVFKHLRCQVTKLDIPSLQEAALVNGLITVVEAAAFHKDRLKEHPDWFGEDVRQRLEAGLAYTSVEYAEARRKQVEISRQLDLVLETHELILLPTTQITAPLIEGIDAVDEARQLTRFTAPFNLTGLPALSVPCGFTKDGLPIGLQIVGRRWREAEVLQAGHAYEKAAKWNMQPKLE